MTSPANQSARGELRIYLGFAAGAGKTFQMLRDAVDAARVGVDLVVGYAEMHQRQDTLALAEQLEMIPRHKIVHDEREFEEMDVEAILRRKPQICLVDELAHTNAPGAERAKRWEDVLALLDAGISVWTTLNVQHIESLNDSVFDITGSRERETVPDWVIKQATEIQLVDVTPEALLNRLRRGAVHTGDMAQAAVERFFRESNLRALREMAMRQTALEVQVRQEEPAAAAARDASADAATAAAPGAAQEKILLLVTGDPTTAMVIRRARRVADYIHANCVALYVHREAKFADVAAKEREAVEQHLNFARNLRIETRVEQGENVAHTVADFARRNQVTQIFLPRALLRTRSTFRLNLVRDIIRLAPDVQITVAATRREEKDSDQRPVLSDR